MMSFCCATELSTVKNTLKIFFNSEIGKTYSGISVFRNSTFNSRAVKCLFMEDIFVVEKF